MRTIFLAAALILAAAAPAAGQSDETKDACWAGADSWQAYETCLGESAAPGPSDVALTVTGTGNRATEPLTLAGGTYQVDVDDGGARVFGATLERADGAFFYSGRLDGSGTSYLYALEPGVYYWNVIASSAADWTITTTPV